MNYEEEIQHLKKVLEEVYIQNKKLVDKCRDFDTFMEKLKENEKRITIIEQKL